MRILSPYIQMVPKPAGTAAHIPPERDERQGLNHAARPDRPIAFSGRTLCIFCGRGNRLGIGGKIMLVMQTPSASQTGNTDGAVSFGGTIFSDSPVAGLSINLPSSVKREPWQGQSHVCSCGFHFNAQPRWGQRLAEGVRRLTTASKPLTANWGRRIVLEGGKTPRHRGSASLGQDRTGPWPTPWRRSFPPLVETGGHIQVGCAGGIGADIGNAVQRHAVLGSPVGCLPRPWDSAAGRNPAVPARPRPVFRCGGLRRLPAANSCSCERTCPSGSRPHTCRLHSGRFPGQSHRSGADTVWQRSCRAYSKGKVGGYNYFVCRDFSIIRNCSCSDQLPHRRVLADVQAL